MGTVTPYWWPRRRAEPIDNAMGDEAAPDQFTADDIKAINAYNANVAEGVEPVARVLAAAAIVCAALGVYVAFAWH